jgi:hypothetical protein
MESVSATGFISEEAVKFLASYYEERKIFFLHKGAERPFLLHTEGNSGLSDNNT